MSGSIASVPDRGATVEIGKWNIESLLPSIRCPVLAVQGREDEYATLAQIEGIGDKVAKAQLLPLDASGHSVHRDQPEQLTRATLEFLSRHISPTSI